VRSEQSVEQGFYEAQSFGKPFHIRCLPSERAYFHCTRSLSIPWDNDREAKVARGGLSSTQ